MDSNANADLSMSQNVISPPKKASLNKSSMAKNRSPPRTEVKISTNNNDSGISPQKPPLTQNKSPITNAANSRNSANTSALKQRPQTASTSVKPSINNSRNVSNQNSKSNLRPSTAAGRKNLLGKSFNK